MAETIVINAATREIKVPESEVNFGVAGERKVEKKHFRIEGRVVEGTDLAVGFAWKVSCENAGKELCADLIDSIIADTDGIEFDWIVGAGPMRYKGDLKFAICAIKTDALGSILQEWHSQIGHGLAANGIEANVQDIGGQDLAAWLQQNAAEAKANAEASANSAAAAKKSEENAAASKTAAASSAAAAKKSESAAAASATSATEDAKTAKQNAAAALASQQTAADLAAQAKAAANTAAGYAGAATFSIGYDADGMLSLFMEA